MTFIEVWQVYEGSDGEATKRLYAMLEHFGAAGAVAINLFRAQKCSARAKVYRGGGFRGAAYDRKQWSMDNLCQILAGKADEIGVKWGWKEDPEQAFHKWVLYIDLPIGQVSFHTASRGAGPDYAGEWDGSHQSPNRVVRFVASLFLVPVA